MVKYNLVRNKSMSLVVYNDIFVSRLFTLVPDLHNVTIPREYFWNGRVKLGDV